jgi:hypothetical protein
MAADEQSDFLKFMYRQIREYHYQLVVHRAAIITLAKVFPGVTATLENAY